MSSAIHSCGRRRAGDRGRCRTLLVVLTAAPLLTLGPADAAVPSLEDAQRELEGATAEQAAGDDRLRDLDEELVAGEEELTRLEEQLGQLMSGVEEARAAEARARHRSEVARQRRAGARSNLDEAQAQLAEHARLMEAHAVRVYTGRAAATRGVGWLNGLVGSAGDQAIERMAYLEVLGARDIQLLESSQAAVHAERGARQRLLDAEAGAERAEREAVQAGEQALALVAEQKEALAAAQRAQQERGALLAQLEDDQSARAALIRRLEARTQGVAAQLEAGIGLGMGEWVYRLPPAGQQFGSAIVRAASSVSIDPRLLA
ncbi:MAG: hypothetical protein GEU81_18310, partial [Nitriliruptorales bacterium]|nr:hypothetical protein [Nitriliruptorales bacterium]